MSGNGKRVDWQAHKTFEAGDLIAKVNVLPLERPRYSIALGRKHSDDADRIVLFFSIDQIPEAIALLEAAYSEHIKNESEIDAAAIERLQAKDQKRKNYLANVERRKQENRDRAHGHEGGKKK